jgi:UDP-N-acetylmuramoyl-tripeptide--D-alanyl-D-alanine ligase
MPTFDPKTLEAWTGGCWTAAPSGPLTGFCADSRRIAPGQVFVALATGRRDGHDFIAGARQAGAAAAIVARAEPAAGLAQLVVADPLAALQAIAREHRRAFRGAVIGITGSAGKTSTKDLMALLLGGEAAGVLATEANLNNHIGVALTLTCLDPARHRFAVVEAGISAPGEMNVLARMIEPDLAVVTFVGPAHLEELGGLDGVAAEKAALAHAVRPGGVSYFPGSCLSFAAFRALPEGARVVLEPVAALGGGGRRPGQVRFTVAHSGEGTRVTLEIGALPGVPLSMRRVTDGMAQNAALAAAVALRAGVSRADVMARLGAWQPAAMRGEWRGSDERSIYLDCYNANPASMADALAAFSAAAGPGGPRLYVVGCMEELGSDADRYHEELGRSLRLAKGDRLFAVGGLANAIVRGAVLGGALPEQAEAADSVDPFAGRIAAFRGSIFVKGSRRHALERAFPETEPAGVSHA